jgi:hypothetical protein
MTGEENHRREMGAKLDVLANYIFAKSIKDGRAGELLYHLFDGGGVTVDANTHEIIYLSADLMKGALQ